MAEKDVMNREDASRIQSGTDKKEGQGLGSGEGFKERAQSAVDRKAEDYQEKKPGDRIGNQGGGKPGTTPG